MKIPASHPRKASLEVRQRLVEGVEKGITSMHGLIAHGRGEAFDYLLGEETELEARYAIKAAADELIHAERPVLSINGNVAALSMPEMIKLAHVLNGRIEVNLFHFTFRRLKMIELAIANNGGEDVLLEGSEDNFAVLPGIDHARARMHPEGIAKADVVFVPLEDGDRCEALVKAGKKVITIDLNPLSRTAQSATITIVDNIVRALPILIETIIERQTSKLRQMMVMKEGFDNKRNLKEIERIMRKNVFATQK